MISQPRQRRRGPLWWDDEGKRLWHFPPAVERKVEGGGMTILEKAARAAGVANDEHEGTPDGFTYDKLGGGRERMNDIVRAVLTAIREPDEEMLKAAGEALYMPKARAEELAEHEKFAAYANDGKVALHAMIDAILNEKP